MRGPVHGFPKAIYSRRGPRQQGVWSHTSFETRYELVSFQRFLLAPNSLFKHSMRATRERVECHRSTPLGLAVGFGAHLLGQSPLGRKPVNDSRQ
jgi:hypothetical protein